MKYPTSTALLAEAKMYCIESFAYTMDYKNWDDAEKKMQRLTFGKYCQLWLGEFCKLNDIPYKKDISSPYVPDKGDIYINGWNIDCKSTVVNGLEGQIFNYEQNKETIDAYAFFKTNRDCSFIEPLGFIKAKDVLNNSTFVEHNEKIPGTSMRQNDDKGTHFVNIDSLIDFNIAINGMKNKEKKIMSVVA